MNWEKLIEQVKPFKGITVVDGYIQHNGLVFCKDLTIAVQTGEDGSLEPVDEANSIYHLYEIILAITDGELKESSTNQ